MVYLLVLLSLITSRVSIVISDLLVGMMQHSDAKAINEFLDEERVSSSFTISGSIEKSLKEVFSLKPSVCFFDAILLVLLLNIFYTVEQPLLLLVNLAVTVMLFLLSRVDYRSMLLPDSLLAALLSIGILVNLEFYVLVDYTEALTAMVFSFYAAYTFIKAYELLRKKEMMGRGDIKLFSLSFMFFSVDMFSSHIVVSSVIFLFSTLIVKFFTARLSKVEMDTHYPFGPAICLSVYLHMLYGDLLYLALG